MEKHDAKPPVILWFRSDLRLHDHAGVAAALASGQPVLPVYIWDENTATRPLGAASKWWLHRSLAALGSDLRGRGSRLIIERGNAQIILAGLAQEFKARTIICSHTFDPETEVHDRHLSEALADIGAELHRHNTTLLTLPNSLTTQAGQPFRVFTPFYKALQASGICDVRLNSAPVTGEWSTPDRWPQGLALEALGLEPKPTPSGKDWAAGFDGFKPGEAGARGRLRSFLKNHLKTYAEDRDRPDLDLTSHLSPHLRFGEISPQRILFETAKAVEADQELTVGADKFRAELAWREFSYGLLAQQPRLDRVNFKRDFDSFEWRDDDAGFGAWCRGETGYPMVDAGMRELWQTGYMHNRVRMVAASFLVKHLLIDWRRGEQWFWDCLLDADPANNPASWQWVAGCGADAAPYFRIFNPITQAEKFDPKGQYRARYIPGYAQDDMRLAHMKKSRDPAEKVDKSHHIPDYTQPIVDHALARERALATYKRRSDDMYRHGDEE
ncbi:MAG: deoxyribodipyrimidine photo-lyase [Asticcacaulis sp.]|uniref:cryptochrome/photolyase family protein n=1 Tax=Asticcacaulis sp. TaxID=1872648 RepID=UPI0039E462A9